MKENKKNSRVKSLRTFSLVVLLSPFCIVPAAYAGSADSGDTAWVLMSSALVMMMTPAGLALFYGGMSRYKNLLNAFAMIFATYCISSLVWVAWGYTTAFGSTKIGLFGSFDHLFLNGISPKDVTGTIPTYVFVFFQMTFACITVSLITGSVVERIKFSFWIIFSVLWLSFIYSPVAHWAWGGGWMAKIGALDFAGGTVVHINAGIAGLVLSLMTGKRMGYGKEAMFPSSIALTTLGASLLWFGWFGFNAGSALTANGIAGSAIIATNSSAAAGALLWMLTEWYHSSRPTVLGMASGGIAGLVAITPAAGFVGLSASILIGMVAGIIGYFSVTMLKKRFGYDDSLDAFGVHGICGIWGALATGIFADPQISDGAAGLLYGNPSQLLIQFLSIAGTVVFSAAGTCIIAYSVSLLTNGIRISPDEERIGLDGSLHGERAFEIE